MTFGNFRFRNSLLVILACLSSVLVNAQLIIQPPILGNDVGQFQILEVNLMNNSGVEANVIISYEIYYGQTSADKIESSGTTKAFKIPVTGLMINAINIQNVLMPVNPVIRPSSGFSEYLLQNAKFPDGHYKICIKLIDQSTQSEVGNICYEFKIENMTSIFLVSPANNDVVNTEFQLFSWTAMTQLTNPTYEMVIIEVLKGQSLIQAAQSNRAFYTQEANSNIIQLSFASRAMNNGSKYLWYVRIKNGIHEIARSELWLFMYDVSSKTGIGNNALALPLSSATTEEEEIVNAPELSFPKLNASIKLKDLDTVDFVWKHQRSNIKGSIIYEYSLYRVNETDESKDSLIYLVKKKEELKLRLPKTLKLSDGEHYRWKVVATGNKKLKPCKKGCSSAMYVFETGHSTNTIQYYKMLKEERGMPIKVTNGQMNFSCCISIEHHDGISLKVINNQQEEIVIMDSINTKDSHEKLMNMGSNHYSYLTDDLKPGDYVLQVGNKNNLEYLRFSIPKK